MLIATMTTKTEPSSGVASRNATLQRCLKALQAAKSDSELFAALLLVTKCARAGELDDEIRRQIFNAVGFSFPNRLLLSKPTHDGCPDNMFRGLGLTLLACFCTDPSLATHPQVLNKIPILNETVTSPCKPESKDLSSMIKDAYQCLVAIVASPQGLKHLVSRGTVASLCQVYLIHNYSWENALRILTSLLTLLPDECWKKSCTDLQLLLVRLCEEFDQLEDSCKFELAEILPIFLPASPVLLDTSWGRACLKHLCKGLFNILSNRISISQRDSALKLGACLSNVYGTSWILARSKREEARFLSLIVNLACVEIRMALENREPLDSRQAVATACYALVEMGIQACTKEKGRPKLTEEQKLQLLQVMHEACGAVLYYLQEMGRKRVEDPFVLASVRLLGVWLAEGTSCLKQEVIQLLPFMVNYMKVWYQQGVSCRNPDKEVSQMAILSSIWGGLYPGDAIRFLLPAMCHLSAEESPRKILISEGVPALLCDYYLQQWEVFLPEEKPVTETKQMAELSLQSCCGVFLNLVVTEPTLVAQENCFVTLLKHLVQSFPVQLPKDGHLTLKANIATLGLMISCLLPATPVLQEGISQDFFLAVIQFLSHCHVASSDPNTGKQHVALRKGYVEVWENISELWFLGVQAFSACLPVLPWLSSLMIKSGWLQDILYLLGQVSPESVDSELVTVLQAFLIELANNSVSCRELMQQQGGLEKANIYDMAALEQCLSEI